jgi:Zn-dependent protease with chaperone function
LEALVSHTIWLLQRVVLAIVLMIGFSVLTFVTVVLLLWIPYTEYRVLHRVDARLALGCLWLAYSLVTNLLPRRDPFTPPGLLLDEAKEPRLFGVVREIADATRQAMPSEIYLLGEANAFVAQRGGVMGIGSRRVMGIGLPLLHGLPPIELRAVIAHEFGHYTASDVALSPWIHTTRSAIARSVAAIDHSIVASPLGWYGRMFMRLTAMVSKRQEFVADQVSARVVGADVAARALQRVSEIAPAYVMYSRLDVMPLLRAGFIPPIHEGFHRFLKSERYRELVMSVRASVAHAPDASASDTHPPLPARLQALGASPLTTLLPPVAAATSLLSNPDKYERMLMVGTLGATAVDRLRPIRWEQVATGIYAAQWRALVTGHGPWLAPLTLETLPKGREALLAFAKPMKIPGGIENSVRLRHVSILLGAALGVRLIDAGWVPEHTPGSPVTLRSGARTFDPFRAVARLADGSMSENEWAARCQQLQIAGPLLPPALAAVVRPISRDTIRDVAQEEAAARRRRRSW